MSADVRLSWSALIAAALFASLAAGCSYFQDCANEGACVHAAEGATVRVGSGPDATIQACVDAAGPNGTCVLPSGYSATLTFPSNVTIRNSGTTIRCEPGAVIQQGAGFHNANMIVITGNRVSVTGCTLRGDSSATNSALLFASSVSGVTISNNVVADLGADEFGFYVGKGTTDFRIQGNSLTERIVGRPVYVISSLSDAPVRNGHIRGNRIATTGGNSEDDIVLFSNAPGALLSNVDISENTMSAGPESCEKGGCFCVEVGGFGGPGPTEVVVNKNVCTATADVNGGYSLAGTPPSNYRVTENVYDAGNHKTIIAAFEVSGTDARVYRNVARDLTGPGFCLSVNMLSASTITENECAGFSNRTNGAGICVYGGFAGKAGENEISKNKIVFPETSENRHYGIWVQCNQASVNCSGNKIVENRIEGNGGIATRAIVLERDYGTMTGTTVSRNEIVRTDIGVYIGAGVLDTTYLSGGNDATIPLVNHGIGTRAE